MKKLMILGLLFVSFSLSAQDTVTGDTVDMLFQPTKMYSGQDVAVLWKYGIAVNAVAAKAADATLQEKYDESQKELKDAASQRITDAIDEGIVALLVAALAWFIRGDVERRRK